MPKGSWTVDEVIELGLQAIGDEIERLHRGGVGECEFCAMAEQLPAYLKAALLIAKGNREERTMKDLKEIRDGELQKLIAAELGCTVPELQEFLTRHKGGKGARAS